MELLGITPTPTPTPVPEMLLTGVGLRGFSGSFPVGLAGIVLGVIGVAALLWRIILRGNRAAR